CVYHVVFSSISYILLSSVCVFFFSSRRRHTRSKRDWSSDVCSSDLAWRITALIYVGVLWLLIIAGFITTFIFDFSYIYSLISIGVGIIASIFFVYAIPKLRYRQIGRASCRERVKV